MNSFNMYKVIIISIIFSLSMVAQNKEVKSGVYSWVNSNEDKGLMLKGSTIDLDNLKLHSVTISHGQLVLENNINKSNEKLFIIKEGELKFKIKEDEKVLGPNSIVLLLPNEEFQVENISDTDASYYLFQYKSKANVDMDRGISEGGSFWVDWNELEFHPHDRGGIRQYFERATAMFHRFEMHVTTLNPGIKSHEPHTHTSDEMVLMINGNSKLQIGDSYFDASAGDLIFLGANKPHALSNSGTNSCMYFAFHGD